MPLLPRVADLDYERSVSCEEIGEAWREAFKPLQVFIAALVPVALLPSERKGRRGENQIHLPQASLQLLSLKRLLNRPDEQLPARSLVGTVIAPRQIAGRG